MLIIKNRGVSIDIRENTHVETVVTAEATTVLFRNIIRQWFIESYDETSNRFTRRPKAVDEVMIGYLYSSLKFAFRIWRRFDLLMTVEKSY